MLLFKKKKLGVSSIKFSLWIVAGIILVLFVGSSYVRAVIKKTEIQKEIDALKMEKEKLEANNSDLSGFLDYFASESYKEREMRLKLNMQKPGEKVVIISQPEENNIRDSVSGVGEDTSFFSNIKKWKEYFLGK